MDGKGGLDSALTSGWAVESDRLLKESLTRLPGFGPVMLGPPTWQQVVMEVGPALTLAWPGWTGHPQETVPRSLQQGPRREAGGIGGGTLEQ